MRQVLGWFALSVCSMLFLSQSAVAFHVGAGVGPPPIIPIELARRFLDAGEHPIFVDLRPAEDFRAGRLPGARSLPFQEVPKRYSEIPRTGRVILYCACTLKEVEPAYQFLWDHGYRNISFLGEGFPAWVKQGYPLER